MKALSEYTTSDLIERWQSLQFAANLPPEMQAMASFDAVAAELDSRCEKMRLHAGNGKTYIDRDLLGKFSPGDGQIDVPPSELRDLLTWLLMKGGANER